MKHKMNLQDEPFYLIDNGTKTVELRLYDEKRQKINVGDILEFNNDNTDKLIETEVVKLHLFADFKELYKAFNKIEIGYHEDQIPNPSDMEQYYKKEAIEKYGVVGIEIRKI